MIIKHFHNLINEHHPLQGLFHALFLLHNKYRSEVILPSRFPVQAIELRKIFWQFCPPTGSMGTEYFLQLLSLISGADFTLTIGLYYKHIMIINDDSSVVNKWRVSRSDDTRVVIYNRNMFIIQATALSRELNFFFFFLKTRTILMQNQTHK